MTAVTYCLQHIGESEAPLWAEAIVDLGLAEKNTLSPRGNLNR